MPIAASRQTGWSRKRGSNHHCGWFSYCFKPFYSLPTARSLLSTSLLLCNNIGIVGGGLLSIILVTLFRRPLLKELQQHVNQYSSIKLGWAGISYNHRDSAFMLVALGLTLKSIFAEGYGGYPLHIYSPLVGVPRRSALYSWRGIA